MSTYRSFYVEGTSNHEITATALSQHECIWTNIVRPIIGMTGLAAGDTQAILRGQTMNGTAFAGMDSVKVAGSKNH